MEEHLNIEEKINKKSETLSDKVNNLFAKIDFFRLDGNIKEDIAIKVKDFAWADKLYWIQVFLSSVIASLWLLQNSIAVVIWAMLIAPFLKPLNWIAFSISRWEKKFFRSSFKVIIVSIFISIMMWFFTVKLTWIKFDTSEILIRTSPNILDFFIAIFSSVVAVLSLRFNRLSESVAWVAIAAALMPPLWVVWIELALWKYEFAFWAMILFLANLFAIILVWTIIFWLFWFTPHGWTAQKISVERFIFIIIIVIWISIPLIWSLISINEKYIIQNKSNIYLTNIFEKEIWEFYIDKLDVLSVDDSKIKIFSIIKIPEWLNFYDTLKNKLDSELSKELWKKVEFNIELIRIANIISEEKIITQ